VAGINAHFHFLFWWDKCPKFVILRHFFYTEKVVEFSYLIMQEKSIICCGCHKKLRHISSQKLWVETIPQRDSAPFKKKPYSYTYCDALHILSSSIYISLHIFFSKVLSLNYSLNITPIHSIIILSNANHKYPNSSILIKDLWGNTPFFN